MALWENQNIIFLRNYKFDWANTVHHWIVIYRVFIFYFFFVCPKSKLVATTWSSCLTENTYWNMNKNNFQQKPQTCLNPNSAWAFNLKRISWVSSCHVFCACYLYKTSDKLIFFKLHFQSYIITIRNVKNNKNFSNSYACVSSVKIYRIF